MYRGLLSIYSKIKASVLLMCLGLMIMGTCPIQKFLLSTFPIQVEASSETLVYEVAAKGLLTCSYGEEIIKTPLIELTKKSDKNLIYFILLSTLTTLLSFVRNGSIPFVKKRISLGVPVPLYLRNQVFII